MEQLRPKPGLEFLRKRAVADPDGPIDRLLAFRGGVFEVLPRSGDDHICDFLRFGPNLADSDVEHADVKLQADEQGVGRTRLARAFCSESDSTPPSEPSPRSRPPRWPPGGPRARCWQRARPPPKVRVVMNGGEATAGLFELLLDEAALSHWESVVLELEVPRKRRVGFVESDHSTARARASSAALLEA